MQEVLYVPDSIDPAHVALDASDEFLIVELPAQDDDAAVGVQADLSLRNRAIAEELAFDLSYEADVIELRHEVASVGHPVGDPGDLARLVMGVALDAVRPAPERSACALASEVPSTSAAAWIEEVLQSDTCRQRRTKDRCQLRE